MKLTGIIENVFGGRYVFRGYATLANLVKFSKPNYSYQRPIDNKRIEDIESFLKDGSIYRFFSELLFGLQFKDPNAIQKLQQPTIPGGIRLDDGIKIVKAKFTFDSVIGENPSTKIISLDFDEGSTQMSRIDGNHRLMAVERVLNLPSTNENDELKQQIGNIVVPFSVLLQQEGDDSEKFESAIFFLINSKAKALTMEENLKSLLRNKCVSNSELQNIFSIGHPELLRLLAENINPVVYTCLSRLLTNEFYTCIFKLVDLFDHNGIDADINETAAAFMQVNNDFEVLGLKDYCKNINVICAMVYFYCKNRSLYKLLIKWISTNKVFLVERVSAETIIELFNQFSKAKKKIFVAMPYFGNDEIKSTNAIYHRVIDNLNEKYSADLELLGEIMTYKGTTINIVNDVLTRINECDICFCDITDNNPNVTYEMGMARALSKHLVLLREINSAEPKSDYKLDYYDTYKKNAYVTLEESIERNLKAILKDKYNYPIDD